MVEVDLADKIVEESGAEEVEEAEDDEEVDSDQMIEDVAQQGGEGTVECVW
jgi:hypothetical protein